MMLVIMHLMISIMIMMIMFMMSTMMSKKSLTNKEKMSPFECGFNPMSKKRLPFSIHFFMIAIIFLIFDIEIIIILPSILTIKFSMMKYWLLSSMMFIMILLLGLYYEWYSGLLSWSK